MLTQGSLCTQQHASSKASHTVVFLRTNLRASRQTSHTRHMSVRCQSVSTPDRCYVGIDFGTSGARAMVIDDKGKLIAETRQTYGDDKSASARAPSWKRALFGLLEDIPSELRSTVASIAIDGTSSTCMLMDDETGELLTTPLMYNEACPEAAALVGLFAPAGHTVTAATSTLSKLVQWQQEGAIPTSGTPRLSHQADWLAFLLHQVQALLC
mmetsp:Transcript_15067/g.25501  ORF Transcript_15067/g.25501 Transcript_15067/m.25501 type:complete len:212 (+) Transcript_15067:126-761(+)